MTNKFDLPPALESACSDAAAQGLRRRHRPATSPLLDAEIPTACAASLDTFFDEDPPCVGAKMARAFDDIFAPDRRADD